MTGPRDFLKRISPYKPGRPVEEVARVLNLKGEIVKLASNENPLGPSPLAVRALKKGAAESNLYPDDSCFYLKRKLANRLGVAPENIFVGNGSVEILPLITMAYVGPEHSAVASRSAFIWFKIAAQIAAAEFIEAPMKDYRHDLQAMLRAIKKNTRLVYIANPNNPTGTIVTREEMEDFFKSVPENVLVVMDEAYSDYIDDPIYPESFGYLREGRNILILRTFSKVYGLAGVRLGYGVSQPEVIASLSKLRVSFNVNRLSQIAGMAALDDHEHVEKSRAANEAGKTYLYAAYRKLGLFYLPTYANFIFVDFGRDSQGVFGSLQKKGIITRTIKEYGFPNALRITIGSAAQNRRLIKALQEIL
jgi:histidinol-phosphate aminotransferase